MYINDLLFPMVDDNFTVQNALISKQRKCFDSPEFGLEKYI